MHITSGTKREHYKRYYMYYNVNINYICLRVNRKFDMKIGK